MTDTINLHYSALSPSPLNQVVRSGGIDQAEIERLAASIKANGVLQALTVRATPGGATPYEIVMGECRWRAAASLGAEAPLLPCRVIEIEGDETERLVLMGVENIQRQNLNPIEEAKYYQALLDRGLSEAEVIRRLGIYKERLRARLEFLTWPPAIQTQVASGAMAINAARYLQKLPAGIQEQLAPRLQGKKTKAIEGLVDKIAAAQGGQNGHYRNGTAKAPPQKPEATVVTKLLSLLVGVIQQNGDLFERCADSLAAFDVELAEEAFNSAFENRAIVRKVVARK